MKKNLGTPSLLFPNPVMVCCTYDRQGKPNAATLAWGGIASSKPAAITIAVQPKRYTYEALMERKAFTVNLVPQKYAAAADYFGIASGRNADKFQVTGLTPVPSGAVDAPYIEEFPFMLACEVTHTLDLGMHTLFVGEIRECLADADAERLLSEHPVIMFDAGARKYLIPGGEAADAFSAGKVFLEEK